MKIFLRRDETVVADWLAYPDYDVRQRASIDGLSFELHPGLYYINAIEWAASALEMSAVGAKNVANLAYERWIQRRKK